MLTGDHELVAGPIARAIGVDELRAGLLPDERWPRSGSCGSGGRFQRWWARCERRSCPRERDGRDRHGGAGTDIALETADVVLMRDDLRGIPLALWLARRSRRVVRQSLGFAFGVIGVLVISTLTGVLPLWLAVVCHEGSTLLVIANGLRLLGARHPDFEPA